MVYAHVCAGARLSTPGVLLCHSHLSWSCTDSQNASAPCLHLPHGAVDTGTLATVPGFLCSLQTQAPMLVPPMIIDPFLKPQSWECTKAINPASTISSSKMISFQF